MDYKVMVKKLRNKMFLTQSEFAKELGVSIASVARWETSENEPTMKIKRSPYLSEEISKQYPIEKFKGLIINVIDIVENFILELGDENKWNEI